MEQTDNPEVTRCNIYVFKCDNLTAFLKLNYTTVFLRIALLDLNLETSTVNMNQDPVCASHVTLTIVLQSHSRAELRHLHTKVMKIYTDTRDGKIYATKYMSASVHFRQLKSQPVRSPLKSNNKSFRPRIPWL